MDSREVFRVESQSARLSYSGGELKSRESDTTCGIAVRVLCGRRLGFAYCQDESMLNDALARAQALSAHSVESGFSFAPPSATPPPDLLDRAFDPEDFSPLRDMVEEARACAESPGGKARVILGAEKSRISLENTEGFSGEYPRSAFSLYVECMHDDGFGFAYAASNRMPSAEASILGCQAADMALSMKGAGKPEAGQYTVVISQEALDNVLEPLLPSFSGDWKRRGITKLVAGEKTFSEMLTIADDPLCGAINSRPFDDEGTPSERRKLVDSGTVSAFLYDRETAALANAGEPGSCARDSYDAPPGISVSNIVISPGDVEDFAELGRHIEVLSAHGSHTANPTTGDVGLEVSAAYLVEDGGRRPLKGFMLSANVFELFRNIEGIGKTARTFGSLVSPKIAFKGVRVVS